LARILITERFSRLMDTYILPTINCVTIIDDDGGEEAEYTHRHTDGILGIERRKLRPGWAARQTSIDGFIDVFKEGARRPTPWRHV